MQFTKLDISLQKDTVVTFLTRGLGMFSINHASYTNKSHITMFNMLVTDQSNALGMVSSMKKISDEK